ncbi:unnamed protein product [Callosobruchus maculatus]|uniref:Regulatory protein zeste n=1 Tax=Callosobruchus maculatus TaxID=64391 RepID=A0A653CH96_CALMS|nr:unnamed protein product [Callosobruchus maculatus]
MAEQTSSQLKGKRRRDPNMVYNEKHILLELIKKYFGVNENKKTDAVSVGKKNEVWEKIRIEFNSQTSVPRTTDTLKNTWKNLKADARKAAEERQSQMKTGGGQYPVIHIEPILEDNQTQNATRINLNRLGFESTVICILNLRLNILFPKYGRLNFISDIRA